MLNLVKEPLKNFEDVYWIDRDGNIYNSRKVLKTYTTRTGYVCLKLQIDGARFHKTVHGLVAEQFVPNPENKPEINHIDGDKTNNRVDNLEWVTSKENKKHAKDTGLWVYNQPTKGIKKGKASKYRNVSYDKNRNKWLAGIRHNKQNLGQKRFDTEEEAAKHVDYIIDFYKLDRPKNFN